MTTYSDGTGPLSSVGIDEAWTAGRQANAMVKTSNSDGNSPGTRIEKQAAVTFNL